jgi:hypothetical protein
MKLEGLGKTAYIWQGAESMKQQCEMISAAI